MYGLNKKINKYTFHNIENYYEYVILGITQEKEDNILEICPVNINMVLNKLKEDGLKVKELKDANRSLIKVSIDKELFDEYKKRSNKSQKI